MQNIYNAGSLGVLASVLETGDVVYTVSCNRFTSVCQMYIFARFCHERGIILHFADEPYLDIGNGKQWRPAVAKVIASMVESEQKAKGMMAQGFKMSDSQWEYAYRCFEMMNLVNPIRTGLGTMAVLVAFVVAGSGLWNYRCVGLGTCH
ncbi:MAG: hypothetical protein ACOCM4_02885 [Acetivibrio ethanolgignens]